LLSNNPVQNFKIYNPEWVCYHSGSPFFGHHNVFLSGGKLFGRNPYVMRLDKNGSI